MLTSNVASVIHLAAEPSYEPANDELSGIGIDITQIWPRLKAGALRVSEYTSSPSYVQIEVYEVSLESRAFVERAAGPSPRNEMEILERILLGEPQKAVAVDTRMSCPSVSQKSARALRRLGIRGSASCLPAALVVLAQLSVGQVGLRREVVSFKSLGQWHHRVSFARPEAFASDLTHAERHVVSLLIDGMSSQQIANCRATARRTVANQIAEAYRKLGTSRRISLIRRLFVLALVTLLCACSGTTGGEDELPLDASEAALNHLPPNAYTLTQRQGESLFVTKLASQGSVVTEATLADPDVMLRGGIVRYATQELVALDHAKRSFIATTLSTAAEEHRSQLAAHQDLVLSLGGETPQPAPIYWSKRHEKIQGLHARAYDTELAGEPARFWYTEDLPQPPRDVRRLLLALASTELADADGHDGRDCDHEDPERELSARDFSGRVLLRVEVQSKGVWTTRLDTTAVARSYLTVNDLATPDGWTQLPDSDTEVVQPGAVQRFAALSANDQPTAVVTTFGGPILHVPEVHVVYWGHSFTAPGHAAGIEQLNSAISSMVSERGFAGMGQYTVAPGRLASARILDATPPPQVLQDGVSLAIAAVGVNAAMLSGGPTVWWKTGPDPLYVMVVNTSEVPNSASWAGYHLAAPSLSFLIPFPINLFAHDFMPFALTTVNDSALSMPAGGMAQRDSCPASGPCSQVFAFDNATAIISHEIEEAVVDPYPFSGFFDPLKFPWWTKGEISDICEDAPFARTRVDDYAVSTYWSNVDFDCIGNYRAQVHILAPSGTIPANAAGVQAIAEASAAIDRGAKLSDDAYWFLDGLPQGRGLSRTLLGLAPGQHHLEVRLTDSNEFEATDSVDFTIDSGCAADYDSDCGSCGGRVQCDGSCSVYTPGDFGQACGSCGGTTLCDGSCSIYTPGDFGQACGCGGTTQCDGLCTSLCSLNVNFSNIDDDAYVWLAAGFDGNPASAICQINQGPTPRSGDCDLGAWMDAAGIEAANLILKIGNGGCFNSHGDVSFSMNGVEAWAAHKEDTGFFTHCGWTYRAVVSIDRRYGTVFPAEEPNYCFNVTDCPF